jgi:peptidoglycan/xylan/chitin deacetylase (PgdA/CDA1 family)
MATKVLLTIDTELTWRHYRDGDGWEENFDRSYQPAGVGIPYQLEVLAEHGLKACFFVDPMPALLYGPEPLQRMVDPILAAGQEVQLHLHPFWANLAAGDSREVFELTKLSAERQEELIATGRALLVKAGVPDPCAFRAGSFAANADTAAALARLGFRYDSSHNGCHHPWPSALPLCRRQTAPVSTSGLIEVPVSLVEERPGQLRHLQVCAVSFRELRDALRHARRHGHPVATIVSHSFELATRDGLRPNRLVQRRFVRLCRFLAAHRTTLPTARFADLEGLPLGVEAQPMAVAPTRRYGRMVSQMWGTARYERPSEVLTASSGTTLTGAEALLPYVG